MRRIPFIVFAIGLLFLSSCETGEVKPRSEDSEMAQEAFSIIESMRTFYVNRDIESMSGDMTDEGFKELKKGLKKFDSVELRFTPRLVEISDTGFTVNVSWEGKWKDGGRIKEERGMAVFEMTGNPLKVDAIQRANPFARPE